MEERERGARSPGAGSPARPPSPRLDVNSDSFDPLLALYAPRLPPIPYPNAPCFNNVAAYESFLRTGCRGGGRGRAQGVAPVSGAPGTAGPSGRTRRRRDAPVPDPERIQRLRRLMVTKEEGDGAAGESRRGPGRSRKAPRNVLTRMPLHEGSPLGELHRCIREGVKVNVHIRTFKGLRGVCTGFLVAFDKFWNMALTDVDETYRKPVLGKAYERDSSLTLTRLFDRLKLQDSSKKEADSKSAVEDSTLSRYSQTSTWKVASVWGRGDTDRGTHKHSRSAPSSLQASTREESRSELSGRTLQTEGSSAGGTFSRATTLSRGQPRKKKRKPKVDYQQSSCGDASLAQVGTIIALFPGKSCQSPASGRLLTAAAGLSRWLLATHNSPWQPTATGAAAYAVAGDSRAAQLQVEPSFSILAVEGSVTGPHMWDPNRALSLLKPALNHHTTRPARAISIFMVK